MRALSFRERLQEEAAKAAATESLDPWRLTLARVCGRIDFYDRLERVSFADVAGLAGSATKQAYRGHLSTLVEAYD